MDVLGSARQSSFVSNLDESHQNNTVNSSDSLVGLHKVMFCFGIPAVYVFQFNSEQCKKTTKVARTALTTQIMTTYYVRFTHVSEALLRMHYMPACVNMVLGTVFST
jgi:hypothetical protein